MTPLGVIKRTWYRHEDENRKSLHVHMAIWFEDAEALDDDGKPHWHNITGKKPRVAPEGSVPAEERRAWAFYVITIRHLKSLFLSLSPIYSQCRNPHKT